jgi:NAD(P)-dependent dehydrogenase (short-subunit alcohol dehydrogenase family)
MDLNLAGKTAIVTGGTTGFGAGICEVLAEEGMNIIANYLFEEAQSVQFANDLSKKTGRKCVAMYGDISKAEDIDNIFVQAEKEFGHIDVLVNNAGIWPTTPIEQMADEEWKKVIDINLNGTFMFSKRAVLHFLKHNVKGHIVSISSKSGITVSSPDHAHYVTAKGGVNMMTKALAREFSHRGIIVNGVAPGMIRTPLNEDKLSQPEWLKYYEDRIPVGRVSTAREIAYTVAFLASEKGMFITGAIVDVTGGMLI